MNPDISTLDHRGVAKPESFDEYEFGDEKRE